MKNEEIGYVPDYTTCKGGENLSTEDKSEINAFAEKIWGEKKC